MNAMNRRVGCYTSHSVRKNTFFEKSHLSLVSIVHFVRLWCSYTEIGEIVQQLGIAKQTATDWNSYCREVVINFCYTTGCRPIGGPGEIDEIDEAKFGRRKYNVDRIVEGQWVFGGVERRSRDFFLVPVERRDAATLVPLIQRWILPGTTIMSDCWRAYGGLRDLGYNHMTVNHSTNFVDPDTGASTNRMEGLWRHARHRMPQYRRDKEFFPGYLAKFMFINKMRRLNLDPTVEFLRAAGNLYDPNVPTSLAFAARPATDAAPGQPDSSGTDSE